MKLLLFFCSVLLLYLCGYNRALAESQEETRYTDFVLYGGLYLNANIHQSDFQQLPGIDNCCTKFTSAFGITPNFFIGTEYKFGKQLFGMHTKAGLMLSYSNLSANFSEEEFIGNYISGDIVKKEIVEHSLKSTLTAILTGIYYSVSPLEDLPFSISTGFKIGFMLDKRFEQKEILLEPEEAVFENGTKERKFQSGDIPDANSHYLGVSFNIAYDAFKYKDFIFRTQLEYTHSLTDIASSLNWKAHYFSAGLALCWDIPMKTVLPPPPPIPAPEPLLPSPPVEDKLELALKVSNATGRKNDGSKIRYDYMLKEYYKLFTIMPQVFFTKNSSSLLWKDSFTPNDENEAQVWALNSIVEYLKSNPDEKVALTAYKLDDEPDALPQNRLDAVVEKLKIVGIDKSRYSSVVIDKNSSAFRYEELKDEFRAVEFSFSKSGKILTFVKQQERAFVKIPHSIVIEPETNSDIKHFDFDCDITINERKVESFHNKKCSINLEEHIDDFSTNHILKISGKLTDQQERIARKELVLEIEPKLIKTEKSFLAKDKSSNQFILGFFGFDEAEFKSINKEAIEIVKDAVRNQMSVTIVPLHDSFGAIDHNTSLLRKRSDAALSLFGSDKEMIKVKYPDRFYYPNDNPSLRMLNRSVLVIIE